MDIAKRFRDLPKPHFPYNDGRKGKYRIPHDFFDLVHWQTAVLVCPERSGHHNSPLQKTCVQFASPSIAGFSDDY